VPLLVMWSWRRAGLIFRGHLPEALYIKERVAN
jgi:hypothetical protein